MDDYGNHITCGQTTQTEYSLSSAAFVLYMDTRAVPYWEYFFLDTAANGALSCKCIHYQ